VKSALNSFITFRIFLKTWYSNYEDKPFYLIIISEFNHILGTRLSLIWLLTNFDLSIFSYKLLLSRELRNWFYWVLCMVRKLCQIIVTVYDFFYSLIWYFDWKHSFSEASDICNDSMKVFGLIKNIWCWVAL
jgi:hypothetical protein